MKIVRERTHGASLGANMVIENEIAFGPPQLRSISDLLQCPRTGGRMQFFDSFYESSADSSVRFPIVDGIIRSFVTDDGDGIGITDRVKTFYEENPFPDYEDMETLGSLIYKSRSRGFPEMLNRSIRPHSTVLEVGCGTGQLGNFLSIADRRVLSVDMGLNSLRLAQNFKEAQRLRGVTFAQMNLFRLPLQPEKFDVVICSGVLHHTERPFEGFRGLAPLVKPGGYIVIGLYNLFGRLATRSRRMFVLPFLGKRLAELDPHIRDYRITGKKKSAWFMDQYCHPHESAHTMDEVLRWFDETGLHFVRGLPGTVFGSQFRLEYRNSLFDEEPRGSRMDRLFSQLRQMFSGEEGGLFIMIARKV